MNNGDSQKKITMILVDTSAFVASNSDFIGLRSRLLPSFFDAIREKHMTLVTHPILEYEILKHIEDSSIYKDFRIFASQAEKCRDVLSLVACIDEDIVAKIKRTDIREKTFEKYRFYYLNAIRLPYPQAEIIFNQYFKSKPPFSETGKKKHEFPDAFVIESTKEYIKHNPDDMLLVVSTDDDWQKAFQGVENVSFSNTISDALKIVNNIECIFSEDCIEKIITSARECIAQEILIQAGDEAYDYPEYEFEDDFEVYCAKMESMSDDIVPLRITSSSILIKVDASLLVDGHGIVFDANNSIWDREDEDYVFKSYADFFVSEGEADVECEVLLEFCADKPEETVRISDIKFNDSFCIDVSGGEVSMTPIDQENLFDELS